MTDADYVQFKALQARIAELTDRLARHNIAYRDICAVREQQDACIAELEAALVSIIKEWGAGPRRRIVEQALEKKP